MATNHGPPMVKMDLLHLLIGGSLPTSDRASTVSFGRDSRIRTYGIMLPKQALYQTELHPVILMLPEPLDHRLPNTPNQPHIESKAEDNRQGYQQQFCLQLHSVPTCRYRSSAYEEQDQQRSEGIV